MKKIFAFVILLTLLFGSLAAVFQFRSDLLYKYFPLLGMKTMRKIMENRMRTYGEAYWEDMFTRGIVFTEDAVYAGTFSSLLIFDAQAPSGLRLAKNLSLGGAVTGLVRDNKTLYAISGNTQVYVLDISDPLQPALLGQAQIGRPGEIFINALAEGKGFVFLATTKGLIVVDARKKEKPEIRAKILTGTFSRVFLNNIYAYLARPGKGIFIYNVSRPETPVLLSELPLYEHIKGKAVPLDTDMPPTEGVVAGDYAYVANGYNGIAVVNVSDTHHPELLKHIDVGRYCDEVMVIKNHLVLRTLSGTMMVLSIKDPENPVMEKSIKGIGFTPSGVDGDKGVFLNSRTSFSIVNIKNILKPKELAKYEVQSQRTMAVKADEYFVYAAAGKDGMRIYRRNPPDHPELISRVQTTGMAGSLTLTKDTVFASNGLQGGIDAVDIRFPDRAMTKSVFNVEQLTSATAFEKNILYAAAGDSGLTLYDVTQRNNPAFLSSTMIKEGDGPVFSVSVAVKFPYAYVGGVMDGIYVADIRHPEKITIVSRLPYGANDIKIKGNFAYLAGYEQGILVLDISKPEKLQLVKTYPVGSFIMSLDIEGNALYAADYRKGVFVMDIRDPENIKTTSHYQTQGQATGIDVAGGYAYVADGTAGLLTLHLLSGTASYAASELEEDEEEEGEE